MLSRSSQHSNDHEVHGASRQRVYRFFPKMIQLLLAEWLSKKEIANRLARCRAKNDQDPARVIGQTLDCWLFALLEIFFFKKSFFFVAIPRTCK